MKIPKLPWWGWTLGAIVVAGGVMLYTKRKKAKAPAGSGALPAAAAPTAANTAAGSSTDPYALAALQQQQQQGTANIVAALQGLSGASASSATPQTPGYNQAPYTGETFQGSGYNPSPGNYGFIDTTGNAWSLIQNTDQLGQLMQQWGWQSAIGYQPTPGVAALWNGVPLNPSTPLYWKVPQGQSAIGNQTPSLATHL